MTELIRKSMVMQWKRCPRSYEDFWIKKIPRVPSVEMQLGRTFHLRAKLFFDELCYDELEECHTKEQAYDVFLDYVPKKDPITDEWMNNFLWFESTLWARLKNIDLWKPIATELELESPAVGYKMHIDRIDRLKSSYLINIEYKTGKSIRLADLRFEGTFYSIGINATDMFDKPSMYLGVYNPQLQWQFVEPIKTRTITRVQKTVRAYRQSVLKGEFPPKVSLLCRYCEGLQRCLDEGIFSPEFLEKMNTRRKEK